MAEETKNPPKTISMTLNGNSIMAPAQLAAVIGSEIVDFVLDAMSKADLSTKPQNESTQYKFSTPEMSATERRQVFESWIFSKAFQDLMRGVRGSLEQAYFFQQLLAGPLRVRTASTVEEVVAPFRKKAADLNFPDLLEQVNARLKTPLQFAGAFLSLQRARNCFEHRNGVADGVNNLNADGILVLEFPRAKMFYLRDGEEIEIHVGHEIIPEEGKDGVEITTRLELRRREFQKGQRILLSMADFNEIAFACNVFATDLAKKVTAAAGATETGNA